MEQKKIQDQIQAQINQKQQFQDDVYDAVKNYLTDYKKLKKAIVKLHKMYVKEEFNKNNVTNEADLTHQHNNQRKYLENSLDHNR